MSNRLCRSFRPEWSGKYNASDNEEKWKRKFAVGRADNKFGTKQIWEKNRQFKYKYN